MTLKSRIYLQKYRKKPNNDCTYLTVVGTGNLFELSTFQSLIHIPSGVISKLRNVVQLHKKAKLLKLAVEYILT